MKTDEGDVVLVLMLLAEGCDISVLVRCSNHCEACGGYFTRPLKILTSGSA
jgi:hypothetical protein